MIILSGLPQSWDGVQGSILANHAMDRIDVPTIMPVLQEEWSRRQARRGDHKSSHLAQTNICGGPQRQQWQGGQNSYQQNNYNPQAGPSNYNSSYKPAPYNKFSKKPNYKQNNNNQNPASKGPNWQCNQQNCANKKQAKAALLEKVANLEKSQLKADKKGKGKEKAAPKVDNL
jgi:hypothetical protein